MNMLSVSSLYIPALINTNPVGYSHWAPLKKTVEKKSVSDTGLEPATTCLQVRCSTNWDNQADSPANYHRSILLYIA